ncbi:MAG: hypothetical protein WBP29_00355 [Candidatus Zixiibacteriota bacterium]
MKKLLFTIGRVALPVFAVVALAFALSQFNVTANADTTTTASASSSCTGPCDPADCPMPCAKECTGVKSAACPSTKDCGSMGNCKMAAPAKTASTVRAATAACPAPCAAACDKVSASGCGKTVAQVK